MKPDADSQDSQEIYIFIVDKQYFRRRKLKGNNNSRQHPKSHYPFII